VIAWRSLDFIVAVPPSPRLHLSQILHRLAVSTRQKLHFGINRFLLVSETSFNRFLLRIQSGFRSWGRVLTGRWLRSFARFSRPVSWCSARLFLDPVLPASNRNSLRVRRCGRNKARRFVAETGNSSLGNQLPQIWKFVRFTVGIFHRVQQIFDLVNSRGGFWFGSRKIRGFLGSLFRRTRPDFYPLHKRFRWIGRSSLRRNPFPFRCLISASRYWRLVFASSFLNRRLVPISASRDRRLGFASSPLDRRIVGNVLDLRHRGQQRVCVGPVSGWLVIEAGDRTCGRPMKNLIG